MTRQYVAGELSALLGELVAVTPNRGWARALSDLRHDAETLPVAELDSVAGRALSLADCACWDSLEHVDAATFARQATVCAELYEFGVCAGLLRQSAGARTSNRSPTGGATNDREP